MNKIILACIITTIMTILVLIINPQNQYNLQIINVDFGYHNETIKQDSNMNIQNINKINHIEAKIKNIDNSEQKNLSIQNINRDAYMEKLRSKAQNQQKNGQIDERLAEQNLIRESYMKRLKKERENKVRQQVYNDIATKNTTQVNKKELNQSKQQQCPKCIDKIRENSTKISHSEMIAWDKWRANLANKIINTANSYQTGYIDEQGIRYDISFDVDNKRNITNVNVEVITQNYNAPEGKTLLGAIRRAISDINGTRVLTFPAGTKRTTTRFHSRIKSVPIHVPMKYAKPADYPDFEFVKR